MTRDIRISTWLHWIHASTLILINFTVDELMVFERIINKKYMYRFFLSLFIYFFFSYDF